MTAKIKLNAASGGGSFSLQAPSSSSNNRVFTIPDVADGTIATTATAGKILQVVQTVKKDVFSESVATTAVSSDITGLTVTITPSSASNKILLIPSVTASAYVRALYFYKGGSLISDAIGDASGSLQRTAFGAEVSVFAVSTLNGLYLDTAGGTSAITYSLRVGSTSSSTQTLYINRVNDSDESHSSYAFARHISTFTVMEVAA